MKIFDFDGMFDQKLRDYMQKNPKDNGEEWEDVIPALYKKFGDTTIKSLGKSPNAFYAEMTDDQLIKALQVHLKQNVSVDGFLKNALDNRDCKSQLVALLDGSFAEKEFAVNYLGAFAPAFEKYMDIVESDAPETLKEECISALKTNPDCVITRLLSNVKGGVQKQIMLEILSFCTQNRDEIYHILLNEFNSCDGEVVQNATNLANFGDERALVALLEKIDDDKIDYITYKELKFAIETLGGEYNAERDFTGDKAYEIIKKHEEESASAFEKLFKN